MSGESILTRLEIENVDLRGSAHITYRCLPTLFDNHELGVEIREVEFEVAGPKSGIQWSTGRNRRHTQEQAPHLGRIRHDGGNSILPGNRERRKPPCRCFGLL